VIYPPAAYSPRELARVPASSQQFARISRNSGEVDRPCGYSAGGRCAGGQIWSGERLSASESRCHV